MPILGLPLFIAVLGSQTMSIPISIPQIDPGNIAFSSDSNRNAPDLNVDWKTSGLPIRVFLAEGPMLPSSDFSAQARLAWSAKGLVVHLDVTAPHPVESDDADRLFDGDSVEFMFRRPGTTEDMFQIVVSPGIAPGHETARSHFFDYRAKVLRDATAPSAFVSRTKTEHGYGLTIAVPWTLIGLEPNLGELVGARVTVNHTEAGHGRSRFTWTGNSNANDFWNPPVVKLDTVSGKLNPLQAWVSWNDDLLSGAVSVLAEPELAGTSLGIQWGNRPWSTVNLAKDGERSFATFQVFGPRPGQPTPKLTISVNGQLLQASTPDILALRVNRFRAGSNPESRGKPDKRLTLSVPQPVFDGAKFPAPAYPDRKYAESLVGPIKVKTTYFNAEGTKVSKADQPGRYIAEVEVANSAVNVTSYLTLFRAPDGWQGETKDPGLAAASFEGKLGPGARPDAAKKSERDAIHAVRKRIGTQVRYEYSVELPSGYKPDSDQRWPLIVYLHGSGGGDDRSWDNTKQNDGPMRRARLTPNFPFVAVALRSRGGWFPPAVEDVIDEVEASTKIDKSRIYLTGFSMGGFGTWSTAYDQPERFAAIAPVAAGGGDAALMPLLKELPTWVFNGGDDTTTSPRFARSAVEALKNAGGNVRYTEYPGMGHVDALRLAYEEKDLYTWFLQFHSK